jgi:hypothetical protein
VVRWAVRFAEPSITSLIAWPTSPLAGKADTYHFEVANAATHMMTTEGPSDTVLTLHGPADPDAVLAWDDRGRAANARMVRKLQPGEYWLSVRHRDGNTTGAYSVGVTTPGLMILSNPELDGPVRTLS